MMSGDSTQIPLQKHHHQHHQQSQSSKHSKTNLNFKKSIEQLIINDSKKNLNTKSSSLLLCTASPALVSYTDDDYIAEIKNKENDLTTDTTIFNEIFLSKSSVETYKFNLNPGSIYEVIFCSINLENNFYINSIALICALHELTIQINDYCNQQQQMYIKPEIDDILLAKSITDGIWYRVRILNSSGN